MKGDGHGTRGVALISVMVVVTVVAAAAAQLLYRQSIDIERSTRIMSREQAFLFAFGVETYARELLARDNPSIDYVFNLGRYEEGDPKLEQWSWPIPNREMSDEWKEAFRKLDVESVEARIHDLSSRFNVNGVYWAIPGRRVRNDTVVLDPWEVMYEATFKNLVHSLFGDDDEIVDADALWNALLDWFDSDQNALEGGAEDEDYLEEDPSYVTGQMPMAWPEEIRLVRGFDGKVADRLLPFMTALPHIAPVRMNINTIEANLLRHVVPELDEIGEIAEIMGERADDVYIHKEGIGRPFQRVINHLGGKGLIRQQVPERYPVLTNAKKFFDVKSNWFLFTACVRFGRERPIEIQSVLHRRGKGKDEKGEEKDGQDRVVVMQRRMGSGYHKGGGCRRA